MLAAAQVIHALAERLRQAPAVLWAATQVHTSRAWPLSEAELPAWKVVAAEEEVEPLTVHAPQLQDHSLSMQLQGYARAVNALDEQLHQLASQALAAVFGTPAAPDSLSALGGRVQLSLRRIERALQAEGDAAHGLVQLTLRAQFRTAANAPDTIL